MKLPLTGGCQCRALRYEIDEAPLATYTCHCTDCQRMTGSAFGMAISVRDAAFRLNTGAPRFVQKTADSGRVLTRWLCPDCASWVCSSPLPAATPAEAVRRVRAGSLDDTSWLRPTAHFWTRSKQPWITFAEDDEIFATQPD